MAERRVSFEEPPSQVSRPPTNWQPMGQMSQGIQRPNVYRPQQYNSAYCQQRPWFTGCLLYTSPSPRD